MNIKWGDGGLVSVLVGGSFGSCGKGQIAAWLANEVKEPFDYATTNAGAQAGHTTRFRGGREYICYHLPTTSVERLDCWAYLNGGSIIDVDQLGRELTETNVQKLRIHPNATVITDEDREAERGKDSSTMRIASTMKGVGSALSRKIMRKATTAIQHAGLAQWVERIDLNEIAQAGNHIMVEVPQGFGLSINHGHYYPYTTSRDCWVGSGLSDAGIHPSFLGDVCMVVRTMPIRVGHYYNEQGDKLGDSGPFYPGSIEVNWAEHLPGVEPERTTVTKRVRRIATWSDEQYYQAMSFNRPNVVALTFCDYLSGAHEFHGLVARMRTVERRCGLNDVTHVYSTGNCVDDVTNQYDKVVAWLKKYK